MNKEGIRNVVRTIIGVLVAAGGVAHFTHPDFFQALVPEVLGAHSSFVNAATGVLQTAMGVAFLFPHLRAFARWTTIILLAVTLPAAFMQIVHPEVIEAQGLSRSVAIIRLIAQMAMIALIWWATKVPPNMSMQRTRLTARR